METSVTTPRTAPALLCKFLETIRNANTGASQGVPTAKVRFLSEAVGQEENWEITISGNCVDLTAVLGKPGPIIWSLEVHRFGPNVVATLIVTVKVP